MNKSFDDFEQTLNPDILNTKIEEFQIYAMNESAHLSPAEQMIIVSQYVSTQYSLYLLRLYHEWVNSNQLV